MPNTEPFLPDLLPYLLQRASYLVTREFHRELKLDGVSVSRWRMLAWLSDNEPYSINRLAGQLMLRQPSVTDLVAKAVRDGLVEKSTDPADGRRVQLRLTRKGRNLAETLKDKARIAETNVAETFGPTRTASMKAALRELIDWAEDDQNGTRANKTR